MAKPKRAIRRAKVKSKMQGQPKGSVFRRGRSTDEVVDDMVLGRRRKNQSTDSNN